MLTIQQIRHIAFRYGIFIENHMLPDGSVILAPSDYVESPAFKCGPNKHKWLTWMIPDKVYWNRKPACGVHDWMYTYPVYAGSDYKRAADDLFRLNMDLLAKQRSETRFGHWLAVPMNSIYHKFVAWFGDGSFYSDKPVKKHV